MHSKREKPFSKNATSPQKEASYHSISQSSCKHLWHICNSINKFIHNLKLSQQGRVVKFTRRNQIVWFILLEQASQYLFLAMRLGIYYVHKRKLRASYLPVN